MFASQGGGGGGGASSIETGTKLYISNLDYGVSNDDLKVKLSYLLHPVFLSAINSFGIANGGGIQNLNISFGVLCSI